MTEDTKASLIMGLQEEFQGTAIPETKQKVQKFSEATKTLYSDEELAKKKVKPILPERKVEVKEEKSIDELITEYVDRKAMYEDEKKKAPTGVFMGKTEKADWHSGK